MTRVNYLREYLLETPRFQKLLKEKYIRLLMMQIEAKYSPTTETSQFLYDELFRLEMDPLKKLFCSILYIDTIDQLNRWIDEHATLEVA